MQYIEQYFLILSGISSVNNMNSIGIENRQSKCISKEKGEIFAYSFLFRIYIDIRKNEDRMTEKTRDCDK